MPIFRVCVTGRNEHNELSRYLAPLGVAINTSTRDFDTLTNDVHTISILENIWSNTLLL